jgi:hypothetical protein
MLKARAYLNYGRWVAECPAPGCTDARAIYPEDPITGIVSPRANTQDVCANGHPFAIEMPPADLEGQIVTAVSERPNEADQAWYPTGHPAAIRAGQPSGQSVTDLLTENQEVAEYRAAQEARQREELLETLGKLGIEVQPDGSFTGSI